MSSPRSTGDLGVLCNLFYSPHENLLVLVFPGHYGEPAYFHKTLTRRMCLIFACQFAKDTSSLCRLGVLPVLGWVLVALDVLNLDCSSLSGGMKGSQLKKRRTSSNMGTMTMKQFSCNQRLQLSDLPYPPILWRFDFSDYTKPHRWSELILPFLYSTKWRKDGLFCTVLTMNLRRYMKWVIRPALSVDQPNASSWCSSEMIGLNKYTKTMFSSYLRSSSMHRTPPTTRSRRWRYCGDLAIPPGTSSLTLFVWGGFVADLWSCVSSTTTTKFGASWTRHSVNLWMAIMSDSKSDLSERIGATSNMLRSLPDSSGFGKTAHHQILSRTPLLIRCPHAAAAGAGISEELCIRIPPHTLWFSVRLPEGLTVLLLTELLRQMMRAMTNCCHLFRPVPRGGCDNRACFRLWIPMSLTAGVISSLKQALVVL